MIFCVANNYKTRCHEALLLRYGFLGGYREDRIPLPVGHTIKAELLLYFILIILYGLDHRSCYTNTIRGALSITYCTLPWQPQLTNTDGYKGIQVTRCIL